MKKIALIAYPAIVALSMLAAVTAHAQSESMNLAPTGPSASGLTRAQVQAELFQARADGSLKVSAENYSPVIVTTFERTRAEVRAEAIAASRSRRANWWLGEGEGAVAQGSRTEVTPLVPQAPVYAGTPKLPAQAQ